MTFSALVVDDEPSILKTFAAILEIHNFRVQIASSAAAANAKLQETMFDLVLTDMSMESAMAGYDVLRTAKSQPYRPVVVIVSAYPALVADWKNHGADAMFQKPTILSELLDAVNRLMKLRTQDPDERGSSE
jgi:CheY-like chemotaxis protein